MIGTVLELIGDGAIIAFGIWSLYMFINIIWRGNITFIEPNRRILIAETILAGLFGILGLERLINDLL